MHDTDTTTTATTTEPDHRLLYASDRLTMPLAMAAIDGQREGLLTFDDLPWGMPDGAAFLVSVHKVLTATGALSLVQREAAMNARAAVCPWWCQGRHPAVFDAGDDVLLHRALIATVALIPVTGDTGEAEETISQAQLADGYEGPYVDVELGRSSDLTALQAASARALSAALTAAADRLEEIERMTPA